ncbi:hypothetical protein PPTG_08837 [Phytophthora nicotianae INRA-310]|uniref:Polycystin cation channel PKD1/PKD2 domain-containing protein n=1 Tax=Phytophthora nicotianae (strain INRA-310) TaxID=761204 RepID=W2QJU0_PHYN3|nr:hypothetical protein PPTG_08837 [Phytophthora nicotianae INRA-310]ETN12794.1 hypothetical protein PPTG_08837 [Phytophthora nicotianae INRA-310]
MLLLRFNSTIFAGLRLLVAISILLGSEKPTQQLFDQSAAVSDALAPPTDQHLQLHDSTQFRDIGNADDIFDWLTFTLIPTVFFTADVNETLSRRGYLDLSNQILGGVILEKTAVGFRDCNSTEAFVQLYPYCLAAEHPRTSSIFLDLNMSSREAANTITSLKMNDTWVNYHTKLFRVTVATYNSNTDTFSVTRLDVNFREAGELEVLADSCSNSDEFFLALREVIEALDDAAIWVNAYSMVGAITIIQLGSFVIRQLRFHPRLNVFARTVATSLRQFRDFIVIFIIIFMTFSLAGNSLFGKHVYQFSSASNSIVSCMNMLFQTFDYNSISSFRGAGIYFWSYMIVINTVLLNMMLAMVIGVYQTITQEGHDGEVSRQLIARIRKNYPSKEAIRSLLCWRGQGRTRLVPTKDHPARSTPSIADVEALEFFKNV